MDSKRRLYKRAGRNGAKRIRAAGVNRCCNPSVNYLLTNEHGLSLLQCIYDYINSDAMTLSYQGKEIEEDIVVSNSRTQNTYSLAHNEYDAVLLTQIQQELVLLKHNAAK